MRIGVLELDLASGELRKNGRKLRLQEQPLQVLTLLLERAGDVVTREEMRQKLRPADTFVDFDHSLNTAVNKLREALGDSASSPRYVETLARRGYRFIAPFQPAEPQTGDAKGIAADSLPPVQLGPNVPCVVERCLVEDCPVENQPPQLPCGEFVRETTASRL